MLVTWLWRRKLKTFGLSKVLESRSHFSKLDISFTHDATANISTTLYASWCLNLIRSLHNALWKYLGFILKESKRREQRDMKEKDFCEKNGVCWNDRKREQGCFVSYFAYSTKSGIFISHLPPGAYHLYGKLRQKEKIQWNVIIWNINKVTIFDDISKQQTNVGCASFPYTVGKMHPIKVTGIE